MTLNELADMAPEWLAELAPAAWYERYGRRVAEYRLPRSKAARHAFAVQVGDDGFTLEALDQGAVAEEKTCASVKVLKQRWELPFERTEGQVRWCEGKKAVLEDTPRIQSP